MPSFTFKGFITGSAVALSTAQGASSDTGSVSTWGQGNMGDVSILVNGPALLTAPMAIWFEATNLSGFAADEGAPGAAYDPSFHDITFIWTIKNQPARAYQSPQNMVPGLNDANRAYGKKVALHFTDPGTYTIELWAVDRSGTSGLAETTVTIVDPDTVYPGANTICFSNDPGETWAGEKPGCRRMTNFGQLTTAVNTTTAPLRILFKRDQTIPSSTIHLLRPDQPNERMTHLGAWGSGSKPVLMGSKTSHIVAVRNTHGTDQMTIENLEFRGGWNAATETGVPSVTPFNFWENAVDTHFVISQCDFSGFHNVWTTTGPNTSGTMILADCTATDWQDYGFYNHRNNTGRYAMLGCRVVQNVEAGNGNPNAGYINFYNEHGPIRHEAMRDAYFACTDFFTRNGWSGAPPDTADQACIRVNQSSLLGASFNMDRCVCEGGYNVLELTRRDGGISESPGNYLVEKSLLIGTAKTWKGLIACGYGGLTVRNSIGVLPNVPAYHPNPLVEGVRLESGTPINNNLAAPMQIYGNSFLNLRNAQNDPGLSWQAVTNTHHYQNVTVENNVVHAPDLDSPVTSPVDILQSVQGVSPRYKGVLFNEFGVQTGSIGSVAIGSSFTVPYPAGTNQAYWQNLPASDNQHAINLGNNKDQLSAVHYAELGEMNVTFESSGIRVTNTSSGVWSGNYFLKLDRKSQKSTIPTTYESPTSIPLPRPTAKIGASLGLIPHDDFEGTVRGSDFSSGAIEH